MSVYDLKSIRSRVQTGICHPEDQPGLEGFVAEHFSDPGMVLLFLDHEFLWATWGGNNFGFGTQAEIGTITGLRSLRLFNADRELFLRRMNEDGWRWRLRSDGEGEEQEFLETRQILLGRNAGSSHGFTLFREAAGWSGYVPGNFSGERIAIRTHNYIGFAGDMLANIEDSRFLNLEEL